MHPMMPALTRAFRASYQRGQPQPIARAISLLRINLSLPPWWRSRRAHKRMASGLVRSKASNMVEHDAGAQKEIKPHRVMLPSGFGDFHDFGVHHRLLELLVCIARDL